MKKNTLEIIFTGIVVFLLVILVVIILSALRSTSERPSLEDVRSIRLSIEGFTKAKDLQERLHYVAKSTEVQKKMRTYLIVPFTKRKILDQKIKITKFSYDPESDKRTAIAVQELTYFSENDKKTRRLQTTFKLENHGRWLISDFLPRVNNSEN